MPLPTATPFLITHKRSRFFQNVKGASSIKCIEALAAFSTINRPSMGGNGGEEQKADAGVGGEEMEQGKVIMDVSLKELSKKLEEFAKARDWEQYHSPRNLLLAMVGEVGELSEIFQWRGEVARGLPNWNESDKEHLGEELSDVLLYLIRLADMCGIDLADAASRKIVKNGIKYPAKVF